jgi:nucleotide-binding universal stress UspA family protein
MRTVVAAIDADTSADSIVRTALMMGELTGAAVRAVHVAGGDTEGPASIAEAVGIPWRILVGPVGPTLLETLETTEVIAAVIGGRHTADDGQPVGPTALHLLERTSKPVVMVTGDAPAWGSRRLLIPLEGSHQSSAAVTERLTPLLVGPVELIVLHVFTGDTVPRMLDRPQRDLALLGDEFLCRHLPGAHDIRLRSGTVGDAVIEECAAQAIDLVVLSWSQDGSAGRAAVIRDVLHRAPVPVLVLPE